MTIAFFLLLIINITLYILSRNRYEDLVYSLCSKEYPLKSFFPLAIYLLEKINYRYNTRYDKKLINKIIEVYGVRNAKKNLIIHWANKISTVLFALLIIFFFGMAIGDIDKGHVFYAIIVLGTLIYGTDRDLNKKLHKRHIQIKLDFPDFLNELTLLIDAGMNVSTAWKKIVSENTKERPLYDELKVVVMEINAGKSEQEAYESFARRCRMPEVTKFVSVVLQNLRKGSNELTAMLRLQANECWVMRKDVAKKLGEEASTKLLLPIGIMFIAILIITVAPAILQLRAL